MHRTLYQTKAPSITFHSTESTRALYCAPSTRPSTNPSRWSSFDPASYFIKLGVCISQQLRLITITPPLALTVKTTEAERKTSKEMSDNRKRAVDGCVSTEMTQGQRSRSSNQDIHRNRFDNPHLLRRCMTCIRNRTHWPSAHYSRLTVH